MLSHLSKHKTITKKNYKKTLSNSDFFFFFFKKKEVVYDKLVGPRVYFNDNLQKSSKTQIEK